MPSDHDSAPDALQIIEPSNESENHKHSENLECKDILNSIGLVTYQWDIETDKIYFDGALSEGLTKEALQAIQTQKEFASLSCKDNLVNRFDTIMNSRQVDQGDGVAYKIFYQLHRWHSKTTAPFWVEETGRWFANNEGRPYKAYGVMRLADEYMRHEQEQERSLNYDTLTGYYNRHYFLKTLEQLIQETITYQKQCAFLCISINNLAHINEYLTMATGDSVITKVAHSLNSQLRQGDAVGRLSGNKIGVILMNADAEQAQIATTRLHEHITKEIIETSSGPLSVSISCGATLIPQQAQKLEKALQNVQQALAHIKEMPSKYYQLYEPNIEKERSRQENKVLSDDLILALNERRFRLGFQPIVDVKSGKIAFHEALLRLVDGHGALLTAGRFINLAEKMSLIRLLDLRGLELGIEALKKYPDLEISLNVSNQTLNERTWLDYFSSSMSAMPDLAKRLMIEITESTAMSDLKEICAFIDKIQNFGAKVAIDDFGSGYTSFGQLKNLKVDVVKIDGEFVKDMHLDPKNYVFVQSLVNLARTFSAKTVAEWVTNKETAQMLKEIGVDYMQGEYTGLASFSPQTSLKTQDHGIIRLA